MIASHQHKLRFIFTELNQEGRRSVKAVKCLLRRTRLHFLRFYSPSSSAFMLEPEYQTLPNFKIPFPKTTPNLPRMVVKVIKILNWGVTREIKFKGWVQTHGFQKSINYFSIIIHTYALAGMSWEVFILLRDIVRYCKQENQNVLELVSVLVDEGTSAIVFDMLIKVFASNSMLEHAYYVFVSATNVGIELNIRCCNFLFKCLVEDNRVDGVRFLFEDLIKFGPRPNIHTYTIMMNFYCRDVGCSVDDIRRASEILGKIYRSGETPNVVTFSTYVKGLCKVGYLEVAWKLIQKLCCENQPLNYPCFNAFIYGLCQRGMVVEALEVFKEMTKAGITFNVKTYTMLINLCIRNCKMRMAYDLFEEMKERDVYPDQIVYTTLIAAFCNTREMNMAQELFDEMLRDREGCSPM